MHAEPSASAAAAPAEPLTVGSDGSHPQRAPYADDPLTRSEMARAIAILRITRGWSQTDLARTSGVHASAISTYERSRKMPSMSTVARLIVALSYTIQDLDATIAFVRERDHAERLPAKGRRDPEAHRLAANAAQATYDFCYATLARASSGSANGD
jgi:transcriptional regulator with XRE-family HTH domain